MPYAEGMKEIVQYLTSPLLTSAGVSHGWFMHYGGVSTGLFDSLNGKKGGGDRDENVRENRLRATSALGLPSSDAVEVNSDFSLSHIIHEFKDRIIFANEPGDFQGYDASFTDIPQVTLSQTTADCGTLIISDSIGSIVALVHGSWHTLRAEIIKKTVAKLKDRTESQLIAAIGPMICRDCYEFGPEAATLFQPAYVSLKSNKYYVDLKRMIQDQLLQSGVTHIDDLNICTLEDERFFSHRRNGTASGRFLTIAKIK